MSVLHIVGIDPGLVHTGVVRIAIDTANRTIATAHTVVPGIDGPMIRDWAVMVKPTPRIFIEKYIPRSNFDTDERMVKGEAELKAVMPEAVFLRNTGVKTIVTPQVLNVLELTRFRTGSHHQDLLSASRIAVLGMMKDDGLNPVLADIVRDYLDGKPWEVQNMGGTRVS